MVKFIVEERLFSDAIETFGEDYEHIFERSEEEVNKELGEAQPKLLGKKKKNKKKVKEPKEEKVESFGSAEEDRKSSYSSDISFDLQSDGYEENVEEPKEETIEKFGSAEKSSYPPDSEQTSDITIFDVGLYFIKKLLYIMFCLYSLISFGYFRRI